MTNAIDMNQPGLDVSLASRFNAAPANDRVAVVGSSSPAHNSIVSATSRRAMAYGALVWAAYLSRQRFHFSVDDNYGVPGDNSGDVLRRIDRVLAATDAATIVLDFMSNDGTNGLTLQQSKNNYLTIVQKIRDAGRLAVCLTPRPRNKTVSENTLTAAQMAGHLWRRDFIMGLNNPRSGVHVVDAWDYLSDRSTTDMAVLSGMSYDGLHGAQMGEYWVGYALSKLFGLGREPGLFPFVDVLAMSAADLFSASDNPRGSVNNNPMLVGGATTATGWAKLDGQGLSTTLSKVTSGNKIWQQCVMSGTATGTGLIWPFYQSPMPGANLSAGDRLEGFCDFEMDAGLTGISGLGLAIMDNVTFGRSMIFDTTTDIAALSMPGVAHSGVMRVPRFTVGPNAIRGGIAAVPVNGAAASATFRVGACSFRKVA